MTIERADHRGEPETVRARLGLVELMAMLTGLLVNVGAIVGVYVTMSNNQTRMAAQLEALTDKIIEDRVRITRLESEVFPAREARPR